jgi:hypothetical protein
MSVDNLMPIYIYVIFMDGLIVCRGDFWSLGQLHHPSQISPRRIVLASVLERLRLSLNKR